MQVVMNKYFLLNPEKHWRRSALSFFRKKQKLLSSDAFYFRKNDVTEPKGRLL